MHCVFELVAVVFVIGGVHFGVGVEGEGKGFSQYPHNCDL